MKTFKEELRSRYPKTHASAANGSRKAAIRLQCLECVGGLSQQVRDCTSKDCFLYPFRTGSFSKKK